MPRPINRAAEAVSVMQLLAPLAAILDAPGVTDVCVNPPGCVHIEAQGQWTRVDSDQLTLQWAHALAMAAAAFNSKRLDRVQPFLATALRPAARS